MKASWGPTTEDTEKRSFADLFDWKAFFEDTERFSVSSVVSHNPLASLGRERGDLKGD
jgi:hypothetical protein